MAKPSIFPILFITTCLVGSVSLWDGNAKATEFSTIETEQGIHFLGIDGSDVLIPPGQYAVEAAEAWLRVVPRSQVRSDAWLLEASPSSHEETIEAPMALSVQDQDNADVHRLALLFPDGSSLETVGTYSGIRTRGLKMFMSRARLTTIVSARRKAPRRAPSRTGRVRDNRTTSSPLFLSPKSRCVPPLDRDRDCIADRMEDALARKYAPEIRLAPTSKDKYRPASVDWYLAQVHMRFDHKSCRDHQVLGQGKVNQRNIHTQSHRLNKSLCRHKDTRVYSKQKEERFFLQPPNDKTHEGAPPSQWRVYVHVRSSKAVSGGVDVQYWFFYPYNDSPDPRIARNKFNHEGDWEGVTITLTPEKKFHSAFFSAHHGGTRYVESELTFLNRTHIIVYSAAGSHANYPKAGTWPFELIFKDHTYNGGPKWQTWTNLVNVGEKAYPLNGQTFILYGGRWGEVGSRLLRTFGFKDTSGPIGPAFKKNRW